MDGVVGLLVDGQLSICGFLERDGECLGSPLGEFLTYWLEEVVKPNLAPATYANYELFVRRHIAPRLGARRLDRLTVRNVQTWINEVTRTCLSCAQGKDAARPEKKRRCSAIGKCCEARLSSRTVNDIRACLRAALSQAVTEGLVAKNMASTIKIPSVRKRKGKAWSSEGPAPLPKISGEGL